MPAIIKPSRVAVAVKTEAARTGGAVTTISAFLLFDFETPRSFLTEQALWPMVVEQMPAGSVFDKGDLKPLGELVVVGAALAPTDEPVQGMRVAVRLGPIEKHLAVFGDRAWRLTDRGIEMMPAEPFDRMRIDAAHAFGGPEHKINQRGRGHRARAIVEAGYDAPLPNVEDAANLIKSVDDRPVPAHFGPIAPDAAERLKYAGTYDQHWLKNVAPAKPEDFNPLFHCDAPEDQRLAGYFEGNETFAVAGMTRGATRVDGTLPDVRLRAFVHRPEDDSLTETRMVCDTVTLFPNITKAVMAFRGLAGGEDRLGYDIGTVMLAVEHAEDEPRPVEYYAGIFRLRTDPKENYKHALSDFQLMPPVDPAVIGARRAARLERALAERDRHRENSEWGIRRMMAEQGIPDELMPAMPRSENDDLPVVAMPTAEEIERGDFDLAELVDDVEALKKAIQQKVEQEMVKAELARREIVRATPAGLLPETALRPIADEEMMARHAGLTLDEEMARALDDLPAMMPSRDKLQPFLKPPAANPSFGAGARVRAADELDALFDRLDGAAAPIDPQKADKQFELACARMLGQPEGSLLHEPRKALSSIQVPDMAVDVPAGPDDPKIKHDFAALFAGIKDRKASPASAHALPADLFPTDRLKIDKTKHEAAVGEAMGKANKALAAVFPKLSGPDGAGDPIANLMAVIDKVKPAADPALADLPLADRLAHETNNILEQMDEAEAVFAQGVSKARQVTPTAIFPMEPFLPGVAERFGAFIVEQAAAGRSLKGADLAGAMLRGADFRGLDLAGTCFERADLTGALFSGAMLDGAVFTEAVLDGADLTGATLVQANLSKASLKGATLDRCTLSGLLIINADLSGASLRHAVLDSLRLIECRLDGADLSDSRIADFHVLKGSADRIVLARATISRANGMSLSLKGGSMRDAVLERVSFVEVAAAALDMSGARLASVGFLGNCDMSRSRFDGVVAEDSAWNTVTLAEAGFPRAQLHRCLFNACDMTAVDLRLASLRRSRLDRSVLADSDLFGANLFEASLANADLRRVSMRGANLYRANLTDAKLASSDLSDANLGRTFLEH